jgi:hypothetical protein
MKAPSGAGDTNFSIAIRTRAQARLKQKIQRNNKNDDDA